MHIARDISGSSYSVHVQVELFHIHSDLTDFSVMQRFIRRDLCDQRESRACPGLSCSRVVGDTERCWAAGECGGGGRREGKGAGVCKATNPVSLDSSRPELHKQPVASYIHILHVFIMYACAVTKITTSRARAFLRAYNVRKHPL